MSSPAPGTGGQTARDETLKPLSPVERLAQSRERLRQYMLRGDGRHEARRRTAAARAEGSLASRLDRLRAMPVVGVIIDAISAWWSNHPLRPAATLAEGVVRDAVAPLTRKHPIVVLAAAFFAGAAVVWFKPWRFFGKSALFAGLFSQIVSRAVTQVPWESVLDAFASFAHPHTQDARDPVPQEATTPAVSPSEQPEKSEA